MSERLGLFVDAVYRVEDGAVETSDAALQFLRFACEVGTRFDRLVLLGRSAPPELETPFTLGPVGPLEVAPLPYYPSLRRLGAVARAVPGMLRGIWRAVARTDVVWVFGPYPFSLPIVACALLRGRRVVLGVRQDTMAYYRSRLPSPAMRPLLLPAWLLDFGYRLLGRRLRVTAVGAGIAARYGAPRPGVLTHTVSLTPASAVAGGPVERDWSGRLRLLSVGRIEPEKTPLLAVEALARLERERPGRFSLTWAGTGRLSEAMRAKADELGVGHLLELPGYVPFGPELLALYRDAHMFVHTALTEGVPQVITEATSAAVPVVATDVGGVAAALDGGAAGLLVPSSDLDALVAAVLRMEGDAELRLRCVERGLELARSRTLEAESASVAAFLSAAGSRRP